MDSLARFRGSLLGLAVGDALGAPVEFSEPGTFQPVTTMRAGGPFGLQTGFWTDDTSLALCLAESLIETGDFDPVDQMRRYCRWYRDGHLSSTGRCFDIGNTTAGALWRFEKSNEPYSGSHCKNTAGNGSLMRIAPVPLFYQADPRLAVRFAGLSSRTTHAATAAVDSCRYFAALITGALQGASKSELLAPGVFEPYPDCWTEEPLCDDVLAVAEGSFLRKQPPEICGIGYVVRSLEAALWAFASTDSFTEGALAAVNLGNDSDTTGAIYGQLAGAFYGLDSIHTDWLNTLVQRYMIDGYALRLFETRYRR